MREKILFIRVKDPVEGQPVAYLKIPGEWFGSIEIPYYYLYFYQ